MGPSRLPGASSDLDGVLLTPQDKQHRIAGTLSDRHCLILIAKGVHSNHFFGRGCASLCEPVWNQSSGLDFSCVVLG